MAVLLLGPGDDAFRVWSACLEGCGVCGLRLIFSSSCSSNFLKVAAHNIRIFRDRHLDQFLGALSLGRPGSDAV